MLQHAPYIGQACILAMTRRAINLTDRSVASFVFVAEACETVTVLIRNPTLARTHRPSRDSGRSRWHPHRARHCWSVELTSGF